MKSNRVPLRTVGPRLGQDVSRGYKMADTGIKGHRLAAFTENGRRFTTEADLAIFIKAIGYKEAT